MVGVGRPSYLWVGLPLEDGPRLYKKQTNKLNKPLNSIPLWSMPQFLPPVHALASLCDCDWDKQAISSLSYFGSWCLSKQQKPN